MADNVLTEVTPKLLAQGLLALRENALMPRLVNRKYEVEAGQKGSTIDVPIPSAVAVNNVAPAAVPPTTQTFTPTSVAIPLDQWKEAPFYLTDKDMLEAMDGTIPMQASEAIKAMANTVDNYILALYNQFYGFAGTPGTAPMSNGTTADVTSVRKALNKQLAPLDDRHLVLDPEAEAAALDLRAFQDFSYSGSVQALIEADLNRKLGFSFWMDQNIPTHTLVGVGAHLVNDATHVAGVNVLTWDGGGTAPAIGDIFTVAGDTQSYVIVSSTATVFTHEPAGAVALANNAVITFKATHTVNLAFHRDAIAFATRPLESDAAGLGSIIQSAIDPISGLALRLEITREHKRTRFSYDMLYGAQVVRRELGARLAG